jgi:hypothetical protein
MPIKDIYNIEDITELEAYPVLDKKIISEIFSLGDFSFANNLITQYLIKTEKNIEDLDATIKRKKTSETYKIAHDLRDSSLYIGTIRIVVISTYIHKHAKKRNIPPLKEAVDHLRDIYTLSKNELERLLIKRSVDSSN